MTREAADKINLKYKYNFVGPEIFALSVIKKLKIAENISKFESFLLTSLFPKMSE